MRKVMGSLDIVNVELNTLPVDEHGIHNTMSIDRATLAPANKPPSGVFQRLPVEEHPSIDLDVNELETQKEPTEYATDQIISHAGSRNDLCYRVCWNWYSPKP